MSNSGLASSYYQDPYQQPVNEEFRKEINLNSEYQQPTMTLSSPTIEIPSEYDQSSFLNRSADEIAVNADIFDPFNFDSTPIIPKRYKESTENDTESFLERVNNNNNRVFSNSSNNNENNNIINVNSNKNNNEWTKSPQNNYSLEDSKWSAKLSQLDSKCEISYSQLQFINLLGEGAFGEVWRANLWGMEVAVKKLKGNFLRASPFVELAEEVAVLKALRHPNCVLFLGFTNPPNFCIITEYMTHGSLRSLLSNQRIRITSKHIIKCALAVARGMNYLHTQSPAILHRDLTSHNILCHDNWTIKVADYGLSTIKDTSSIHFCGAVPWRAPEVEPNVFLPASDVYSFGVILWELVTRSIPYEGRDLKEVVSEVKRGIRLTIPNNCPKFLMELINNCWNLNPDLRPTFHEIIETLKPLEQSANSNHQQIVTCVHEDANLVHLRETDWILSELVVCSGNHMIGKIWTTFFTHKKQEIGIQLLKNNFLQYKDCAHHHGMLTLIDSYGRMILIVGLDSKDSLQEFDKYFHANCGAFDSLIDIICSPIISETYKLVTYNVKNNAKFAHVVSLDIKEGFGKDTLEVFENYGVSGLSRSLLSYCGSLVLSDFNSGKVLIVILYENEEGLIELENSGFFQQQMTNFSSFITSIPNIQRYHVEDDSFAETATECDLSGDSSDNLLNNNVQSIENHLIHVDEMNKQFDDHSPSSSNSLLSVSDSGHNIIHIGDHDHTLDQSHLTSSLTLERDDIDKEIEEWEVVRHTPNNTNEALLYYNQLLKKHLDFGFKKNKGQRYIVLPNGKRESIVRSFFCAYQSHMETGLLHVTSKYIIFESFKLVGKKSKIVMKIRHVISLDKTKYSFLPTKGHSIEITLKNDTVFRFRGLWHRDEFIELIVLLADSFHPRHTILLLTNGAPDI